MKVSQEMLVVVSKKPGEVGRDQGNENNNKLRRPEGMGMGIDRSQEGQTEGKEGR